MESLGNKIKKLEKSEREWMLTAVRRAKTIEKLNKLIRNCGDLIINGLDVKLIETLDEYEIQSMPTETSVPENYTDRTRHKRQLH